MNPRALTAAVPQALLKLDPRHVFRSPVIFVVWVGSLLTTVLAIVHPTVFAVGVAIWLWVTVVFANFAEAMAEGRGKAQADTLRRRPDRDHGPPAARTDPAAPEEPVAGAAPAASATWSSCEAGEVIPGDGEIVEGVASVDESAITGESAPVIRESGGDRCAVTGGTTVLSDRIVVQITTEPGETFLDRMIALVEGADRQKTPNEIALNILLAALTIIFLLVVVALQPLAAYSGAAPARSSSSSPCWSASSPPPSAPCSRPSASPAWTGWSSATCWPCPAAPSRRPATCRPCSSTRPAPSPSATGWPSEFIPVGGADAERAGPRRRYLAQPGRRDPRGALDRGARPTSSTPPRLDDRCS